VDLTERYRLDGRSPRSVIHPRTVEEVAEALREAARSGWAVVPWGSGAHQGYGEAPSRYDLALDLTGLSGIVRHRPANLTVRVEAGIRLADLNAQLAAHGQWLPLDPPPGDSATIGGILATGLSGPLRARYGPPRDLLIGIRVVLADGTVVQGGGEVVKNVAGYDLPRLFCGSLGTLGVIVEAAFKLWPRPKTEATALFGFARAEDAMPLTLGLLRHPGFPLAVEVLNAAAWAELRRQVSLPETPEARIWVLVRAGGWPASVERVLRDAENLAAAAQARERLSGDAAVLLWAHVPRLTALPYPPPPDGLWVRLGVLPAQVAEALRTLEAFPDVRVIGQAQGTAGVIYARAHGPLEALLGWGEALRSFALARGGHFTLLNGPEAARRALGLWAPRRPEIAAMQRIKAQLDPHGRLSPGRMGW
jgi:glycolate oxidase FAD binding subunit